MENELSLKALTEMQPGIFASGCIASSKHGIQIFGADEGEMISWVASRGTINDWAIYCAIYCSSGFGHTLNWIKDYGNKILDENSIKKLVPCDSDTFARYRF